MASDISGVMPSLYQDILPAAYLAGSDTKPLPVGASEAAPTTPNTSNRDDARFSPEALRQAQKGGMEGKAAGGGQLSEAEQRQVDELQRTDQRVRAHEQAHLAAGGGLTSGGARFQYRTGPDGKQYAASGEVQIDTSEEKDPNATIRKAQRIKAAALAPADPSAQDRSVAARADAMAAKARQELAQGQGGQGAGSDGATKTGGTGGAVGQAKGNATTHGASSSNAKVAHARAAYDSRRAAPAKAVVNFRI